MSIVFTIANASFSDMIKESLAQDIFPCFHFVLQKIKNKNISFLNILFIIIINIYFDILLIIQLHLYTVQIYKIFILQPK